MRNHKETCKIQVAVYNNFEQVDSEQAEWDTFVEANGGDIFMTYDWLNSWWKYYAQGRKLAIFLFRRNGELVGILPLFYDKIRLGPVSVRALKVVGSDFTLAQFSLPICTVDLKDVIQGLFDILSIDNWDIMYLGQFAGMYEHYNELHDALRESFSPACQIERATNGNQTYFILQSSGRNR